MKWTKFKDRVPIVGCIYVTDFCSTWTAYPISHDWKSFAKDNPEYAWAEIPIPETPEEPKQLHKREYLRIVKCIENELGELLFIIPDDAYPIIFCPFCGYSHEYKVPNTFNNLQCLITHDDFIKNLNSIDLPKMKHE